MNKIELLKIKLDKQKYYHSQSSKRFFTSLVIIIGISVLSPETFKQLMDGKFPALAMTFLLLTLLYVLYESSYNLFKIRGKIENYYEELEEEYN